MKGEQEEIGSLEDALGSMFALDQARQIEEAKARLKQAKRALWMAKIAFAVSCISLCISMAGLIYRLTR